jgi:hypothetical protein
MFGLEQVIVEVFTLNRVKASRSDMVHADGYEDCLIWKERQVSLPSPLPMY